MVAPECQTLVIPDHRHRVDVEIVRTELNVDYGLRDRVQLSLRLPYERKDAGVEYTTLDGAPYVPPYGDIHHRSETLEGIGDGTLQLTFAPARLERDRTRLLLGTGVTLPFGHTEPDPIVLGMRGLEHQHIQFGSGTFDPRFFVRGLRYAGRGAIELSINARTPLYENDHGYRGPLSIDVSTGPTLPFGRFALTAFLVGRYETAAKWNGAIDEGSGMQSTGLFFGGTMRLARGLTISPGVYEEIDARGEHGETFEQGTTWSLAVTRTF